jgi:hypothetical protein
MDDAPSVLTYLPRIANIGGVEVHMAQLTRELALRGFKFKLRYAVNGDLSDQFRSSWASLVQVPYVRRAAPTTHPRRVTNY